MLGLDGELHLNIIIVTMYIYQTESSGKRFHDGIYDQRQDQDISAQVQAEASQQQDWGGIYITSVYFVYLLCLPIDL